MDNMGKSFPRVEILGESIARRIAAGEVIERPASVVRELMDNAIDAGSTEINLYLEEGGISRIRLVDNGRGMTREDMELCWLPHATSKIRQVSDLESIYTLGFRGEALSSVASCSRLEITSYSQDEENCNRLLIESGKIKEIQTRGGQKGTVVDVSDLFYSIPARKKFMKGSSTESRLCRTTFLEKALPFPQLSFKLFTDNQMKLYLPPSDYKSRVAASYPRDYRSENLVFLEKDYEDFQLKVVAANPEQHRRDRKHIQIFANRRRIDEYAFVQAVEYGFDNYLPGGTFPTAFVFMEVAPHLVDFNIHPAKREAKFHIKQRIHHALVELIKDWLQQERFHYSRPLLDQKREEAMQNRLPMENSSEYQLRPAAKIHNFYSLPKGNSEIEENHQFFENERGTHRYASSEGKEETRSEVPESSAGFRYHGQIFQLFLLVERKNSLMVLDQHAAHERILYDRYRLQKQTRQELLIPQELEMNDSEDLFMEKSREIWEKAGFSLKRKSKGLWEIFAVPQFVRRLNLNFLEILQGCGGNRDRLEKELYANAACKAAIKDGETLDRTTAENLIEQSLALPEPRCPHGRPLWFEVSREELYQLLGRHLT